MSEKSLTFKQLKEALEAAAIAVGDIITVIAEASAIEGSQAPAAGGNSKPLKRIQGWHSPALDSYMETNNTYPYLVGLKT